jgi:uncharacterized membrane protein YcjF (UPF0283 family)
MNDQRKDEGGPAAFLAVGCVVVALGFVVMAGGLFAILFMTAITRERSRAAAAQAEQQAAHARALKEQLADWQELESKARPATRE